MKTSNIRHTKRYQILEAVLMLNSDRRLATMKAVADFTGIGESTASSSLSAGESSGALRAWVPHGGKERAYQFRSSHLTVDQVYREVALYCQQREQEAGRANRRAPAPDVPTEQGVPAPVSDPGAPASLKHIRIYVPVGDREIQMTIGDALALHRYLSEVFKA